MRTANQAYVPRLDALRFLAASLVVLYHVYDWSPKVDGKYNATIFNILFIHGHVGVSLFLVMSGYLMAKIFLDNPEVKYSDFLFNRFLRIFPLCGLFFLAAISIFGEDGAPHERVIDLVTLQFAADKRFQISPLWTIAVEFQFYLIVPFLMAMVQKRGAASLVKLAAVILILRFFMIYHAATYRPFTYDIVYYSLIGHFDQFVVGMLLALMPARAKEKFSNPLHVVVSACALVGLFFWSAHNDWWAKTTQEAVYETFYLSAEGALCGYFVLSFTQARIRLPGEALLASLGAASYSIYLWHEIIVGSYLQTFKAPILYSGMIGIRLDAVFLVLPVVCAVSLLSYRWFELPFLDFRRRYARRQPGIREDKIVAIAAE